MREVRWSILYSERPTKGTGYGGWGNPDGQLRKMTAAAIPTLSSVYKCAFSRGSRDTALLRSSGGIHMRRTTIMLLEIRDQQVMAESNDSSNQRQCGFLRRNKCYTVLENPFRKMKLTTLLPEA